jgi:riboflavin kinase/FMN adenylyltransferase
MASHRLDWNQSAPAECRGGVAAIGNFDGVHLGHRAIMAELRRQASASSVPAVAVTFDPHPLQLLRPKQFQPVLTEIQDRAALLQGAGAHEVVILQTTTGLLSLSAREFFDRVLIRGLDARALVEGPNFGFGRNREGNIEMLNALCHEAGAPLTIAPPLALGSEIVASSRVRAALVRGAVRDAAALLARPYRLRGTVVTGQHRGQQLGFPTANLEHIPTLVPRDGVYAVRVYHEGKAWPGAANIGPNPTFGEQARKIEVHLIGFAGNLVGQELSLDFLERLRDTRPFPSVDLLVNQLRADVEKAKHIADNEP